MTAVHAGAAIERPPGPRYLAELHFAELAPRAPLPKSGTLKKWRASLPDGFLCALVAPPEALASARGPLRFDDALQAAIAWLREAADAVDARAIVLPTPREMTTGQRDRDLLARYVERLDRKDGRPLVWAPGGLWEPGAAARFAERIEVVCAYDPVETVPPPGPLSYARLQAIGGRTRFPEPLLEEVLDRVAGAGADEAFVSIRSPRSFREAVQLQQLADGE